MKRRLYRFIKGEDGETPTYAVKERDRYEVADIGDAELISSQADGYRKHIHYPVLDLDFGAQLVPSRTEGHFHLFLDKALHWEQYKQLLVALAHAGILEWGYVGASIERGASFARINEGTPTGEVDGLF